MLKQKDSQLTFNAKIIYHNSLNSTHKNNQKDCIMIYRPVNKSILLLDPKTHKIIHNQNQISFQQKNPIVEDFVIGKSLPLIINQNTLIQCLINAYSDQFTKNTFIKKPNDPSSIFLMIKPGYIQNKKFGQIFNSIQKQFQIVKFKMFHLTKQNLSKYIVNEKMQSNQNDLKNIQYLSSDACFGFQLKGDKLLPRIRKILGPQNPIQAKKSQPLSLRAKYGSNIIENCCHSSKNQKSAILQIQYIFSNEVKQLIPVLKGTCLCLIKPHIIRSKETGKIITNLLENEIEIKCMRFQKLKPQLIRNYLDLYKFLPQYQQNIKHFNQAKCLYLEIRIPKAKNAVQQFKKICGPYDPSYAKKISPNSIRSIYGVNRIHNAIHCTQLYQDSQSQLKIIFQI